MEQLIKKWADEGNDTVTYFGYGSAKELLFEHPDSFPFDLLLLDIDMDGMDGMALAKEIRKKDQKLPIVFLTNRSEYVFEGYEVGALRYLLKPVEETKLFSLLGEISYALGKERRYLIENVGGETVKIPVDTIYSVEAKGHYIRLHTSAGDYEYKKNLSEIAEELAKDQPIKEVLPKGDLVYPVSQHIGAPANPIVAKGDTVLRGQKIAEAGGFVSSPIYASVSGTVKAIEPRRVAVGDMVNSIVIENDGEYKEAEFTPCEDVTALSKEEIINKVKEAGVVGMGGAGFPADYRRMLENPEELVAGMKIILQIFDKAKGVFGVENNKPDCIAKLQELTKDEPRMEVCPLQTKYPQGGERQLIYAVTGRAINSKMLPADAGCIVDNVETIIAIYNAVKLGKPVMNRVSTITGDAVANPGNFLYYIGTNYAELVEAAGGFKVQPEKIISGGPMMGFSMFSLDIPTTKTSSSLLCLAEDEVAKAEPSPCINCGRCVEACPEQLVPSRLAKMADHGVADEFEKWHGLECIECGSCSFACPAKRQLAQSIKTMKKQVLAAKRKK